MLTVGLAVGLFVPVPAPAQLDQNCVVSVLNRTISVNNDGSWVLPNIPANFGPVRARATCIANGITTFGESALFTIGANQIVNLPHITLGSITAIPASIAITSPVTSLTSAGQTAQLTVTGSYATGNPQDLTAAAAGTLYNVHQPLDCYRERQRTSNRSGQRTCVIKQ